MNAEECSPDETRRADIREGTFPRMPLRSSGLIIRPPLAAPFIVFTCKVVVYDKVLGLGTTDALDPNMWGVFQAMTYAYFGDRTIEKVARIFKR